MARPELWAFTLANAGLFIVSSVLTGLSYLAYRRDGRSTYKSATIGFGFVVLGGLVEPLYQLGARGDYNITGSELLFLQTAEALLIAGGLGILFYAITRYTANGERTTSTEEFTYTVEPADRDNE